MVQYAVVCLWGSCVFQENLMPLDLFSVYSSTGRPSESLEESGLFSMLGSNMIACSSEQLESYSSSEEEILSNKDLTLDKDEIARDLLRNEGQHDNEMSLNDLIDTFDVKTSASSLPPCVTCEFCFLASTTSAISFNLLFKNPVFI